MKTSPIAVTVRRKLEKAAKKAASAAYAPYSKFRVGAAVLTGRGKIFSGCNVENAAYPMCTCAERTAIVSAVAAGHTAIRAVVVYTPTKLPVSPCGGCRQTINEFGPEALVISVCDSAKRQESSLADLLPLSFGPADLKAKPRRR